VELRRDRYVTGAAVKVAAVKPGNNSESIGHDIKSVIKRRNLRKRGLPSLAARPALKVFDP
jgi:hypothetical protein